jgi:hypothetical protein
MIGHALNALNLDEKPWGFSFVLKVIAGITGLLASLSANLNIHYY